MGAITAWFSLIAPSKESAFAEGGDLSGRSTGEKTMSNSNKSGLAEISSLRDFMQRGSAALAATALAGLTANAQDRGNTRKAEGDRRAILHRRTNLFWTKIRIQAYPSDGPWRHRPSLVLLRSRAQTYSGGGWTHQVNAARTAAIDRSRGCQDPNR